MYIKDNTHFHYNSLNQINLVDNNSNNIKVKIYKNNRSRIPIKKIYKNYNSISKINNNCINNKRDSFFSNENNNEIKTYDLFINNKKNSLIKNRRIHSLEQLTVDNKSVPGLMNIMINNKIIKNIFVNKNSKFKISDRINNNQIKKQNLGNKFFNNINKIKENLYNDYNLTFQNIKGNNQMYNINSNNSNNSNIKSTSENNKSFLYNNFKNKNLLNNTNKAKQISPQKYNNNYKIILNKKYSNEYNNINNNFYGMSLRNNNIMNQNRKNKQFQINNFYSNTNIYETNNKTIRDQIFSIPPQNIGIKPSKLSNEKKIKNNNKNNNNRINKFKSFNGTISSTYNKIYQNTEVNKIKNDLISSSSSSDISNNLSALAEDIIKILINI